MGSRNVEERDFIRPLGVVLLRAFDGIPCVANVHEIDALDDAPTAHVQAGYDAFGEHFKTRIHNLGKLGQGPCNLRATEVKPGYSGAAMPLCPKCGIANVPDRVSCSVCGTPLAPVDDQTSAEKGGVLEAVPPAPRTIPGVTAEPLEPVPAPAKTMPGLAAEPVISASAPVDAIPPAPETIPGGAAAPPVPTKHAMGFKRTMIGLAPGAIESLPTSPEKSQAFTGTAKLENFDNAPVPMSPAKPAPSPFQTLLGVAPGTGPWVEAKNEAQQTLLGAGQFSKPNVAAHVPAGSNKGTLIGVAIPGIAPIKPGIEKPAVVEPTPRVSDAPKPVSRPPAPTALPRRYLALALTVTAAFFGLVTLLSVWWWRSTPRLTVTAKTDEAGKDSLELECGNCDDGSRIALGGVAASFRNRRAALALNQPLHMGDNVVSLELSRRGARRETIQLKVPVDFRVVGDITGIEAATPKLRLIVDKSASVTFEVEGQPLTFNAAGHGQFELDVTRDVTGQATSEMPLQKRISYIARTPSGEVHGAASMRIGIVPLLIEAPGPLLITDRNEFKLCGNTMPGAAVDVAGLKLEVTKDGRFCHPMLIRELGKFSIWVTASAKGFAPRKVERTIERNADLLAYGKKVYKELSHELTKAEPANEKSRGSLIAVTGNIVELSDNPPMTRLLLQLGSRRTPEGLVRVVASNQGHYSAGQQVTVFGQVTGSLSGPDGRDIPEISAAFLIPGLP